MLTHRNIVSNVVAAMAVLSLRRALTALSFLPLSHSFERTVDYCYFYTGCSHRLCRVGGDRGGRTSRRSSRTSSSRCRGSMRRSRRKVHEGVAAGSPIRQKIFALGGGRGRAVARRRGSSGRPSGLAGRQARHRRQARVQQDPGAAGRPLRVGHLRRGAPRPRRRRVLLGRRHLHLRRVRPVRDLAGDHRQHAGTAVKMGTVGQADPRRRRAASPTTARSSPRAPTS